MAKTSKLRISADAIADKASRGEDISEHFTNKFTVVRPIRRVNVGALEPELPRKSRSKRPVR